MSNLIIMAQGMKEVQAKLLKLANDVAASTQGTVTRLGQEAVARMKADVPVKTGHLRDSIGMTLLVDGAEFFAKADYAWHVEYGTSKHPGHPYFMPNIEILKAQLKAQMASDINRNTK